LKGMEECGIVEGLVKVGVPDFTRPIEERA
jgi:hypothetical protein